ncbi:MAG: rhodanese-like domain-containing protein [Cyanobacteria bacterium J06626_14]
MRFVFNLSFGVIVALIVTVTVRQFVVSNDNLVNQAPAARAESFEPSTPNNLNQQWKVSSQEAMDLIDQGATLLDARGLRRPLAQQIQGALSTQWRHFSQSESMHQGKLLDDTSILQEKIRQLGISDHTPVVVFGDPLQGWGEEGRIVWMLRVLGHRQAVWVDGGVQALIDAGISTSIGLSTTEADVPGNFSAQLSDRWHISRDELKQRLTDGQTILIDTREEREYQGQTPYGEVRGGHIPGAIHLYFKELLASDGTLLPNDEIEALLESHGITSETPIVAYCTGGIRSAWVTAVLVDLGFSIENYAGSTWEWAASPEDDYPLVQ